jgi:hypothetical protein
MIKLWEALFLPSFLPSQFDISSYDLDKAASNPSIPGIIPIKQLEK